MGKHLWYDCIWDLKMIRDGKVLWEESIKNALVDEGELAMLDSFYRNQNSPTEFYIRLAYATVAETATLVDITNEPSGNGYAPVVIERSAVGFPAIELDSGDYRVTSKQVSFTAVGGSIGPVNIAYLATTSDNSGKLLAFLNLAVDRTILTGDTMTAVLRIKLK